MTMAAQVRLHDTDTIRGCTNADGTRKVHYLTRTEARKAARRHRWEGDRVHIYRCPATRDGWHLGHSGWAR